MEPKQNKTSLNILLADDDADDHTFFKEALKEFSLSITLTTVADGEQLMNHLTSETNQLPHALFLDLNMPRKNGFECLSEIKSNEKLKMLPIIIYSTTFHKKIADILYENGANYYISKPTEILHLKQAVQQTLMLIAEGNILQPKKEYFLLTVERKNSKPLFWFNNFFALPMAPKFN